MPRRPRVTMAGVPLHVIQRGNNRQTCFYDEDDYRLYLNWLHQYSKEESCDVHAYVLMANHVHILLTPGTPNAAGNLMKKLSQRYVQYINRTHQRSGTLWDGRFRSCLIQEKDYVLGCYRYIELNPVRASIVNHPAHYPWSSFRANAQGLSNPIITPHSFYDQLGVDTQERHQAYRSLFLSSLDTQFVTEIKQATNGNFVLGSRRYQEYVSERLGRRVAPGRRGRPNSKALSR